MKTCTECKEVKPLTEFHKNRSKPDGHVGKCKTCRTAEVKEWNKKNPDYKKGYRARNAEQIKTYNHEYYSENRESAIQYALAWQKQNPDAVRHYRHVRRAVIKGSGFPSDGWTALLNFYGAQCAKCSSTENLQLDHIVPLSKEGKHELQNTQILCGFCNISKGNRHTTDYRDSSKGILLDRLSR